MENMENVENEKDVSLSPEIIAFLEAKKASEDAMKRENEKREKAIADAKSAIEKLDAEIASLSQKKAMLMDLLGMGRSSVMNAGRKGHSYRYNGMFFSRATDLVKSLPQGKDVWDQYVSKDWADVLVGIKMGKIPPRILPFSNFIDEVRKVEIL